MTSPSDESVRAILAELAVGPAGTQRETRQVLQPYTTITYENHPIANCWPLIEGPDFVALCESVREHGLLHPISLFENKVLDGRNRFRACQQTGVEPRFVEYNGNDPAGFVHASNETRRHLDVSQRAMVAARLAQLPRGLRPHASRDASATTQTEAADLMGVGRAQVQRARRVQERAVPELAAAVDAGLITVATAAKLVEETMDIQEAIATKLAEGSSAPAAIRAVKGDTTNKRDNVKEADVAGTPDRAGLAATVQQLYAAYQVLSLADQREFLGLIKAARARELAIKEAAEAAAFQAAVAVANGK